MNEPIDPILHARQRFELECKSLRPDLHRFCTRMTGSVSDGEDAVQDALVHAFYHLPELRQGASLRAWLFRIAHNRCVDLLRRRRALVALDEHEPAEGDPVASLEDNQLARQALAIVFTRLPARERAALILMDVLGCSLEEVAEITAASVGAVKAAVHRARRRLEAASGARAAPRPVDHGHLLERYVERFNQRDWAGVRELLAEGARLEVVERTAGPFDGQRYFENYAALTWDWKLEPALVEGVPHIVHFRRSEGEWRPHSILLLEIEDGKVSSVRDYVHIDYVLSSARVERSG